MRKSLVLGGTIMLLVGLAMSAQADVFRLEMGAGVWRSDPSGTIQYNGNPAFDVVNTADFAEETSPYAWIFLKHPLPIIPNIRLEYVDMGYSGNSKGTLVWNGVSYGNAYNELNMQQLDGVFYYNLLDNTFWLTLDLGLEVKYVDGDYSLADNTHTLAAVNENFSGFFPLLYLRLRGEILETGIGVETMGRGIVYNSSSLYDLQLKIDYTLDVIPFIKPGLELGYRIQSVDLDHDDIDISADVDVDFKGFFGGMTVRF